MEKFNINYTCGCIHEIGENIAGGVAVFKPTGNNQPCVEHN